MAEPHGTAEIHGSSDPGTVVLDIGGHMGALVIGTGRSHLGQEIEISPVEAGPRTHAEVRERTGQPPRYAAIFGSLEAGRYVLWRHDGQAQATLEVLGGQVTYCDWA